MTYKARGVSLYKLYFRLYLYSMQDLDFSQYTYNAGHHGLGAWIQIVGGPINMLYTILGFVY